MQLGTTMTIIKGATMLSNKVISKPKAAMVPNELKTQAKTTNKAMTAARMLRKKANMINKVKAPVMHRNKRISR